MLRAARAVDKERFIEGKCAGKAVLDLGCIRHSADFAKDSGWLHARIRSVAERVVGIDYLAEEVPKLAAMGYDVRLADVTKPFFLDATFDVIVAGDLIEHLTNFDGFFDNIHRHLKDDGTVIITTPNPFYAGEFHYVAFKRDYLINPEHTCWIDPQALAQLVDRFALGIEEIHFIDNSWRLSQLICNSERDEYDILSDAWRDTSFRKRAARRIAGLMFEIFYAPYRLLGANSSLVRHSDYVATLKKRDVPRGPAGPGI
jgi:SAM-dependent methyltransferase